MSKQYKSRKHRIVGYLVLQADMITKSPLRIGSGRNNLAEVEVIRLPNGQPYIPASGLVGALYHRFKEEIDGSGLKKAIEILWGTKMTKETAKQIDTWQSHLRVADMQFKEAAKTAAKVKVRDGVEIDYASNTAKDGAKFDYEVLEPECEFTFTAEVTLREEFMDEIPKLMQILGFIGETLGSEFRIGGLTTRGMGLLERKSLTVRHYDFARQGEADKWFEYLKAGEKLQTGNIVLHSTELPRKEREKFSIRATFGLKSAIMIGAPGGPDDDSDKVSLRSNGKPVISGTSLAGAIRHRSYKILRTMGCDDVQAKALIGKLYGEANEKDNGKSRRPIKSRVITHESIIKGSESKTQTRIRIDRFTGGVIRAGLFDSRPEFRHKDSQVKLCIDLRPAMEKDWKNAVPNTWEPALLLHVLKDLWTADLAIGGEKNVGRGLLEGKSATIHFGDEVLELKTKGQNGIELTGSDAAKAALEAAEIAFTELFKTHQTA